MKKSSVERPILVSILGLILGSFVALTLFSGFPVLSQNNSKIIEKRKLIRPEIAPIIEIKSKQKAVRFGEAFEEGEDWLKGITFKLKNYSGREIFFIQIRLEFPETTATGNEMTASIYVGQRPGSVVKKDPIRLKPDEELIVTLDEHEYTNIKKFIELRVPMSSITKLTAYPSYILFSDGFGWYEGDYLRQDPNNPNNYINIGITPPAK